ncbi:tetratricopeptide repeat protein [Saccharothrix sp. AJ9571]|nr:tetratricopeptide repeat protein [Saccharothrix sp. AJ9571]
MGAGRTREKQQGGYAILGRDPRARFVDQLKQLRELAGQPSLAALHDQDPVWLVPQTVSSLLNHNFRRPPPWERISAFVIACVEIGRSKNLTMPPRDMLLEQWRYHHAALSTALDQTPPRAAHAAPASRATPEPKRRRFGAVPPRAGAFQHRAVAENLTRAVGSGGTAVLTGAAATPASVLTGLGGVGKTQLAADHAHNVWDSQQVELLVWISARTRDAITTAYTEIAAEWLGQDPTAPERAGRRFQEWLAETLTPWLIVLDDLQNPADLTGLWPPHTSCGQVVVTTRCRDAALHGDGRHIVDVDLFTAPEALTYLVEKLPARATETSQLNSLADELGLLPLALAQAAAYLTNKPLLSTADYRERLADRKSTLEHVLPRPRELPDEHEQTVAATWSLSIEAANQLDPAGFARPLLDLAALLDPAGIPIAVFISDAVATHFKAQMDRDLTAEDLQGGLECLRRFSLLTLDPAQPHRGVRVHALVQRAVRDALTPDAHGSLGRAAASALHEVWPDIEVDQTLGQALQSNTRTLQDTAEEHLWQPVGHPVLFRLAESLGDAQLLDAAITVSSRLHHQASIRLGPDHPDTLTTRSSLATWRGDAGDLAGAVAAFEQLLTDQLWVLGPEHPETLTTRSSLAYWRGRTGDLAGAVAAFEQLLTDRLRVLGPEHPDTLITRSSLATWCGETGDLAGAVAAFEQLFTDQLWVLGPEHPETLTTRSSLAYWRGRTGDLAGAVAAFEQLLTDRLRVLGPEHPDTLITRSSLATWCGETGDLAGAVAAFEQLLIDELRVLGPEHPETLTTRSSLAYWRGRTGDLAGAVAAFEQLLTDQVQVLGPEHPDTLVTRHDLAYWRGETGDLAGAVAAFEQLLTDQVQVLGPEHPDTLVTRHNLAYWRGETGDLAGAVAAFEQLLTDQVQVLGPDHPNTFKTRRDLAHWRNVAGEN